MSIVAYDDVDGEPAGYDVETAVTTEMSAEALYSRLVEHQTLRITASEG